MAVKDIIARLEATDRQVDDFADVKERMLMPFEGRPPMSAEMKRRMMLFYDRLEVMDSGGGGGPFSDATAYWPFASSKSLVGQPGPTLTFTRASGGTYYGSDGLLKTAAVNEARFDHDPATLASLGLLIEESRANNLQHSEDFASSSWAKTRTTIASDAVVAPDGNTTADNILETAVTNTFQISQVATSVSATDQFCYSVFFKALGRDYIELEVVDNGVPLLGYAVFQFSTESFVLDSGLDSFGFQNVGNGWYRVWVVATATTGATNATVRIWLNDDGTHRSNYVGDITKGVTAWGAQVET